MDADQVRRWREADRFYGYWLDLDPAQRDAWLQKLSLDAGTEAALRALIGQHQSEPESMPGLESVAQASDIEPAPHNGLAGRRIGDWELIEEIGRGGMSVVYRARRLGVDFDQLAAVKLLGMAALGSDGHARFEQERRLLARLRHPHIASLVDGGFADDGTPFLAMTLIEGETLARHCATRQSTWRERVGLMSRICDAVAHAHRNLMVHRDLKPSNIMVTSEGVPILLDFGIAKLLGEEDDSTRTGMRALTPGYAAPEQREGGAIVTATDVYALGIVLGELCAPCGELPRDLHNIIAMATRAEPERRYPDARAFGEDLERLLSQRVVRATPDSTGYRLQSFLRRRRGLVSALAAVAITLCVGLGLALWQAQRAESEADEARRQTARAEAARDFLFSMVEAGDRERSDAIDPPVSTVIARGVERLREAPMQDPELHAEMSILLGHLETSFGRHASATALLDAALASAKLADDAALTANVRLRQGVLANAMGDAKTAIERFDQALELIEQVDATRRETLRLVALGGWAHAMGNTGRMDEARERLQNAMNDPRQLPDSLHRADLLLTLATVTVEPLPRLAVLREASTLLSKSAPAPATRLTLSSEMASVLARLRRHDEALPHALEAARLVDRIHPGDTMRRARVYNNLGSILPQTNRSGEADAAYATAESIYRRLGDDQSPAFAALLHNRGVLLRDRGAPDLAMPLIAQALAIAQRSFGPEDHRSLIALRSLAFTRAEAGVDPVAEREWNATAALGAPDQPAALLFDHFLLGAHIANRLLQPVAARERLAVIETLLEDTELAPSPVQQMRLKSVQATLHSLEGSDTEALALFDAVEAFAADAGSALWSARWRNQLALAEHLQRMRRTDAATQAWARTADLLDAQGEAPASAKIAAVRAQSGRDESF